MKVKVSTKWWDRYVESQPGRTTAAKTMAAERIHSGPGRSWAKSMAESKGKWVVVETKYLFTDQFNIEDPSIRINIEECDAICFEPEFKDAVEFFDAVQKRYDKDWPGRSLQPAFRQFNVLIEQGRLKLYNLEVMEQESNEHD